MAGQPGAVQRLPLTELRGTVIAPVISPLPTAVALIAHVFRGALPELRADLFAQLRRTDVAVLAPLRTVESGDGAGGRPNEIVPPGTSMEEQLEAIAEADPEVLAAGFEAAALAGHPVGPWRAVAADPAPWLRAYPAALRRAWAAVEPLWARGAGTLDREVERVSVACARGAGPELIAQRFAKCAIEGHELVLPSHSGATGTVHADRALALQPLVAPPSAGGWTDDYGDVCLSIRYAAPGTWRAFAGDDAAPLASLAALLGPQRALILRRLDRPASSGALAALLNGVPSMATHHLRAMERAGLVTREREGRSVIVRRTTRGDELVTLYDAPSSAHP